MANQEIQEYAKSLDRAFFIDSAYKDLAIINQALPIGYGQTISQPSLVVEMSQLLRMDSCKRVLEIGTGSGYQTAAAAKVPKELLDQLGVGGIMILPVGPRAMQDLVEVTKETDGQVRFRSIECVRFVEMIGKYGWSYTGSATEEEEL